MTDPKPWYRPRNIILGLLFLAVAWLGIETYRAVTATPGSPIDYSAKLNELVASHHPAGAPNGWDDWMTALQMLEDETTKAREAYGDDPLTTAGYGWAYDFQAVADPAAPDDVRRRTMEVIENLKAADFHAQLARAAAHDRAQRIIPESDRLIEFLIPDLGQFRNLARYQSGRMQLAAAAGDWTDFTDAFDQVIQSAHVLSHQGTLIDHLVGYAIQRLALNELSDALADYDPDAATLNRLATSLDRAPPGPIELALAAEHISALDTIQWTHTDNGRGNGRLIVSTMGTFAAMGGGGPSLPDHKIFNVLGLIFPSKKQTTAKSNEFYEKMIEWAGMTTAERKTASFQPAQWVAQLPFGYTVLKLLLPALEKAVMAHDRTITEYTQARITLALERFRADTGEYPHTLDQLAPSYLAEVPPDPTTGTPFAYERAGDAVSNVAPYSLWPRGLDDPAPAASPSPSDPSP